MLRYLKSRMFEKRVTEQDIALLVDKSTRSIRGKLAEEKTYSSFTLPETVKIRDAFFEGETLEILFASDGDVQGRNSA